MSHISMVLKKERQLERVSQTVGLWRWNSQHQEARALEAQPLRNFRDFLEKNCHLEQISYLSRAEEPKSFNLIFFRYGPQ